MPYRIYDESVLEQQAEFTLSLTIPESAYNVKNADGTQPVVSLKVDATTNRFALGVLSQLNDGGDIEGIVAGSILGVDFDELEALITSDPQQVVEKLNEIHEPFATVAFDASDTDGNTITLALTAPSGVIAIRAFDAMTNQEKLNGLLTTMMPADDEDNWDE